MPRKSPYAINLTPTEARELAHRSAKYTLPYYQVIRAKMILLAAEGLDNDAIGKRLDTRREIVSRWRKRFFEQRLAGLEEQSAQAAPGLYPPEIVVQVKALACEIPPPEESSSRWSSADIAHEARRSGWGGEHQRQHRVALAQ